MGYRIYGAETRVSMHATNTTTNFVAHHVCGTAAHRIFVNLVPTELSKLSATAAPAPARGQKTGFFIDVDREEK